jgi:hypothetical protein
MAALGAVGVDRLASAAELQVQRRGARGAGLVAYVVIVPAGKAFECSHNPVPIILGLRNGIGNG